MTDELDDFLDGKQPTRRSNPQTEALKKAAATLGVDPLDLATVIDYETIGTYSPTIQGGKNNNYRGLIQFGREEYDKYKVAENPTFEGQLLNSVVPYFQDRFKGVGRDTRGATLMDLYKAVNGGNPNVSENLSDSTRIENGQRVRNTIAWHVQRMQKANRQRALDKFFSSDIDDFLGTAQTEQNPQVTVTPNVQNTDALDNFLDAPANDVTALETQRAELYKQRDALLKQTGAQAKQAIIALRPQLDRIERQISASRVQNPNYQTPVQQVQQNVNPNLLTELEVAKQSGNVAEINRIQADIDRQSTQPTPTNPVNPVILPQNTFPQEEVQTLGGTQTEQPQITPQQPSQPITDAEYQEYVKYAKANKQQVLTKEQLQAEADKTPQGQVQVQQYSTQVQQPQQTVTNRSQTQRQQTVTQPQKQQQATQTQNPQGQVVQGRTQDKRIITDNDLLGVSAGTAKVDFTQKPKGMTNDEYALRTAFQTLGGNYGLTQDQINRAVDYYKSQGAIFQGESLDNYTGKSATITLTYKDINVALGGNDSNISPVLRNAQADREIKQTADLNAQTPSIMGSGQPIPLAGTYTPTQEAQAEAQTKAEVEKDVTTLDNTEIATSIVSEIFKNPFQRIGDLYDQLTGTYTPSGLNAPRTREEADKMVRDRMNQILQEDGSFTDYRRTVEKIKNMDGVEYGTRLFGNFGRGLINQVASNTFKGIDTVDALIETISPLSYLFGKYNPSLRNFENLVNYTALAILGKTDQFQMMSQDTPIDQRMFYTLGKGIQDTLGEDRTLRNDVLGTLSDGLGSATGFVVLGLLAPNANIKTLLGEFNVTSASLGALTQSGSMYDQARANGLSESDARLAATVGIPLGATEGFGVGAALSKALSTNERRSLLKLLSEYYKTKEGRTALGQAIKNTAKAKGGALVAEGFEEGTQETVQGTGEDTFWQFLKDRDKGLYEAVKNAVTNLPDTAAKNLIEKGLIAGLTGIVFAGGVNLATGIGQRNEVTAQSETQKTEVTQNEQQPTQNEQINETQTKQSNNLSTTSTGTTTIDSPAFSSSGSRGVTNDSNTTDETIKSIGGTSKRAQVGRDSVLLEPITNSANTDTESFSDLANSQTFVQQGLRGFDVPTQTTVVKNVVTALHNNKIRNLVVQFIPVNVVDDFIRLQRATEMLLHNKPMLKNGATVDLNLPVSVLVDSASAIIRTFARNGTKHSVGKTISPIEVRRLSKKLQAAIKAVTLDLHNVDTPNINVVSGEPNSQLDSPLIIPQKTIQTTENTNETEGIVTKKSPFVGKGKNVSTSKITLPKVSTITAKTKPQPVKQSLTTETKQRQTFAPLSPRKKLLNLGYSDTDIEAMPIEKQRRIVKLGKAKTANIKTYSDAELQTKSREQIFTISRRLMKQYESLTDKKSPQADALWNESQRLDKFANQNKPSFGQALAKQQVKSERDTKLDALWKQAQTEADAPFTPNEQKLIQNASKELEKATFRKEILASKQDAENRIAEMEAKPIGERRSGVWKNLKRKLRVIDETFSKYEAKQQEKSARQKVRQEKADNARTVADRAIEALNNAVETAPVFDAESRKRLEKEIADILSYSASRLENERNLITTALQALPNDVRKGLKLKSKTDKTTDKSQQVSGENVGKDAKETAKNNLKEVKAGDDIPSRFGDETIVAVYSDGILTENPQTGSTPFYTDEELAQKGFYVNKDKYADKIASQTDKSQALERVDRDALKQRKQQEAERTAIEIAKAVIRHNQTNTKADDDIVRELFGNASKEAREMFQGWKKSELEKIVAKYESKPLASLRTVKERDAILASARSQATFFSQLEKVIEQKMPNKASAEQIKGILTNPQNQIKKEEFEWLGMDEFLATKDTFTKQEILAFVQGNNVKVEEVVKGKLNVSDINLKSTSETVTIKGEPVIERSYQAFVDKNPKKLEVGTIYEYPSGQIEVEYGGSGSKIVKSIEAGEQVLKEFALEPLESFRGETKFSQYTLPNGENYRELLLTMPNTILEQIERLTEQRDAISNLPFKEYQANIEENTKAFERLNNKIKELRDELQPNYRSSHFDEPNILAHIRFDERTDSEGRKTLHIAEIQSDWGQDIRKKGVKSSRSFAEIDAELAKEPEGTERAQELLKELQSLKDGNPDMPFKKSWQELAFKRALRWAVENDFDAVSWDTGEVQADRYSLAKQVNRIEYAERDELLVAYDKNDAKVVKEQGVTPEKLENYIGKEAAQKLMAQPKEFDGFRYLEGDDLKVGGEGMKGFYDKILPSFVNKYVKKWNAKVAESKVNTAKNNITLFRNDQPFRDFATREEAQRYINQYPESDRRDFVIAYADKSGTTTHSVTITPQMRESVMQGQPLFKLRTQDDVDYIDNVLPFEDLDTVVDKLSANLLDDGILQINAEGHEFIRRMLDLNAFNALFLKPSQVEKVLKATREFIAESKKNGWTKSELAQVDNLYKALRKVYTTPSYQKTAIIELFEDSRSEEMLHRANYLAQKQGEYAEKYLSEQIPEKSHKEIINSKVFKHSLENSQFGIDYKGFDEYAKREEFITKFLDGQFDYLGLTDEAMLEQAAVVADVWAKGYIKQNGKVNLEVFRKVNQRAYEILEKVERTNKEGNGTKGGTTQSGGKTEQRGEDSGTGETQPREKQKIKDAWENAKQRELANGIGVKNRAFADTLRENGRNAYQNNVEYLPESEKAWSENARKIIEDSERANPSEPFAQAIKEFNNKNQPDSFRAVLGTALIDHLGATGDYAEMTKVANKTVEIVGTAGQVLRASQMVSKYDFAKGVELATKGMKKVGNELSVNQIEEIKQRTGRYSQAAENESDYAHLLEEVKSEKESVEKELEELQTSFNQLTESEKAKAIALEEAKKQGIIAKRLATFYKNRLEQNRPPKVRASVNVLRRSLAENQEADLDILRDAFGDSVLASLSSDIFNSQAFEKELASIELVKNDKGQLLAPNGKVSNLNERLWKTVRTKAFLDFFGDWINNPKEASKVVDANGEPLVVYHGTGADFEVFRVNNLGSHFGTQTAANTFWKRGISNKNLPIFLSIKHPATISDPMGDFVPELVADLKDREIITNTEVAALQDIIPDREKIFSEVGGGERFFDELKTKTHDGNQAIKDLLVSKSFDGAVYINADEDAGSTSYIAFQPTQIKSIFNRGSFSKDNPSILASLATKETQLTDEQRDALIRQAQRLIVAENPLSYDAVIKNLTTLTNGKVSLETIKSIHAEAVKTIKKDAVLTEAQQKALLKTKEASKIRAEHRQKAQQFEARFENEIKTLEKELKQLEKDFAKEMSQMDKELKKAERLSDKEAEKAKKEAERRAKDFEKKRQKMEERLSVLHALSPINKQIIRKIEVDKTLSADEKEKLATATMLLMTAPGAKSWNAGFTEAYGLSQAENNKWFVKAKENRDALKKDIKAEQIARRAARENFAGSIQDFEAKLLDAQRAKRDAQRSLDAHYKELQKSKATKFFDKLLLLPDLMRTAMSTGELSQIGRQGYPTLLTFPKAWGKSLKGLASLWKDENKRFAMIKAVEESPRFKESVKYGMPYASFGENSVGDEHFPIERVINKFADKEYKVSKVPVLGTLLSKTAKAQKRFEHAYTDPADLQRFMVYSAFADVVDAQGLTQIETEKAKKRAVYYASILSGKGSLPKVFGEKSIATRMLSSIGFAPNLLASRVETAFHFNPVLAPVLAPKGLKGTMFAKSLQLYAIPMTLAVALAGIANMFGNDDDDWLSIINPASKSFLKISFNGSDINLDVSSGMSEFQRLMFWNWAKLIYAGIKDGQEGFVNEAQVLAQNEENTFFNSRFLRAKLSPAASLGYDIASGSDFLGRPINAQEGGYWGAVTSRFLPLTYQQIWDSLTYDENYSNIKEPQTREEAIKKLYRFKLSNIPTSLVYSTMIALGLSATQYDKADKTVAEDVAWGMWEKMFESKNPQLSRVKSNLRNLYRKKEELTRQGKSTSDVDKLIEDIRQKYSALPKKELDEAKQQAKQGKFEFVTKNFNAEQIRRIMRYATAEERIELEKILKKKKK